jgi:cysteine synthase A
VFNIKNYIGNTPLIRYNENIFVKLESVNYTGSIKDRPVFFILNKAEKAGKIRPGWSVLVEATSGNTGIALATIGKLKGYDVKIIMPEDMSDERKKIITSLGAEITYVPPGAFLQAIELRDKICKEYPNYYNFNQFGALENIEAHYKTTGKETIRIKAYDSGRRSWW